jgi:hypothetical protein
MLLDKKKTLKNLAGELSFLSSDNSPPPSFRRYNSESVSAAPMPDEFSRDYAAGNCDPRFYEDDVPRNFGPSYTQCSSGTIVPTFQGMDVIFAEDCKRLSAKHDIVGNNRLKVMLTLESKRYSELPEEEQTKVASDLVKAVTEFWHGRMLVDRGFAYGILTFEESVEALKHLLSSLQQEGSGEGTPLKNGPMSASLTSNTSSTTSSKTLLSSAPPIPEFLRNASREILESGRNDGRMAGPEIMQSMAVRSIKERQQKRQMAKGLGSNRNHTKDEGTS